MTDDRGEVSPAVVELEAVLLDAKLSVPTLRAPALALMLNDTTSTPIRRAIATPTSSAHAVPGRNRRGRAPVSSATEFRPPTTSS